MASGACAKRELGVVVPATKAMAGVVEAGRLEVARQQQLTVQASVREAAASARNVKKEMEYEKIVEDRPGCVRSDASFGLLINAIRDSNFRANPSDTRAVPGVLSANAGTDRTE